MSDKVLLAMSGGIDSSVSGIMLTEMGYDIHGLTYRTYDSVKESCISKESGCCTVDALMEAKQLADKLGYPHEILDLRNEFEKSVIDNFVNEYLSGRTPNPCVLCNSEIKWGRLLERADALGCKFLATGHYANVKFENGRYFLSQGVDKTKDQTYFLYRLSQKDLSRTLFPLGKYMKSEVKKYAAERGYVKLSQKKESQEICFIPDNNYRNFLTNYNADVIDNIGEGDFIMSDGRKVGKHKGYPFYTIGQRKGLGVAGGVPLYVVNIDTKTNTILLGEKDMLLSSTFWTSSNVFMKYEKLPEDGLTVSIKVRYRNNGTMGKIFSEGNKVRVELMDKASAVTPGQSAVFYEGDDVVGGGIIV